MATFELTLKNEEDEKYEISIINDEWIVKEGQKQLTEFLPKSTELKKLIEVIPRLMSLLTINGLKSIEFEEKK